MYRLLPVFLFSSFLVLGGLKGQTVQHHDVQVIEAPAFHSSDEKKPDLRAAAEFVVDKTNDFREKEKRPRIAVSAKLAATAQEFAKYMAETGRFGHTADGRQPAERAAKHGYDYCIVAENIAYEFNSAGYTTDELGKKFVEGWKHSPGHRRNMLDPDVTETGVAIARSDKTGYYFAVQMFGRPKSKAIEFKIANHSTATVEYKIGDQAFNLPPRYTRTHEQCRPSDVTIELAAADKKKTQVLKPANGSEYVVSGDKGELSVTKK